MADFKFAPSKYANKFDEKVKEVTSDVKNVGESGDKMAKEVVSKISAITDKVAEPVLTVTGKEPVETMIKEAINGSANGHVAKHAEDEILDKIDEIKTVHFEITDKHTEEPKSDSIIFVKPEIIEKFDPAPVVQEIIASVEEPKIEIIIPKTEDLKDDLLDIVAEPVAKVVETAAEVTEKVAEPVVEEESLFHKMTEKVHEAEKAVFDSVGSFEDKVVELAKDVVEAVKDEYTFVSDKVAEAIPEDVKQKFTEIEEQIEEKLSPVSEKISEMVSSISEQVEAVAEEIFETKAPEVDDSWREYLLEIIMKIQGTLR